MTHLPSWLLWSILLAAGCAIAQAPAASGSGHTSNPLIGTGRGIDHVTLLTNDLAGASKRFAEDFGFKVGPAKKLDFGFEQATIYFADRTYIELYAIHDPEVVRDSPQAFAIGAPEGVTWVTLHVESTQRTAEALRQLDKPMFGPDRIPDSDSDWYFKLTGPEQPFLPGGRIFFVEYNDAALEGYRAEKRDFYESREVHANLAQGLRSVWISVPDLSVAATAYEAAGLSVGPELELGAISARAREIRTPGGTILLAQPRAGSMPTSRAAAFSGVSIKVSRIDAIRSLVLEKRGLDLQPYAGLYGESVLVPASLGYGASIEFFQ